MQEPLRIVRETIAVKDAEPVVIDVRISRHGPLISDAINANNAASARIPRPGTARAARVQVDGARSRGHDDRRVPRPEPGAQLDGVHRALCATSSFPRRTSCTRTWTVTSATTRPAASRFARAETAPSPREGWTGACRVDRLDSVRRPAACVRSARSLHRHGQPQAGAGRVSVRNRRRVDRAVPGEAHRRPVDSRSAASRPTTSRRSSRTRFPSTRRHSCRCCFSHVRPKTPVSSRR